MNDTNLTLQRLLLLTFLFWLTGSALGQSTSMVPPVIDPRSTGLGGVSGGDGDFVDSLWRNPGLLGLMNRNQFYFQRSTEEDRNFGVWTREQFGMRRAGKVSSLSLGFREARHHFTDSAESHGGPLLDRRLALGLGRTLNESGSLGIGAQGTASFLDRNTEQLFGYGIGLGFHFAPVPDLVFSPSAQLYRGERFDELDVGDRFGWNFSSSARLWDRRVLIGAEFGALSVFDEGFRVGAEADILRILWPAKNLSPLEDSTFRIGLNEDGVSYGFGFEVLDLRFDVASGCNWYGRYSSWSIAHAWGKPQRDFRLNEVDRYGLMSELEMRAEDLRRKGRYEDAAQVYDDLARNPEKDYGRKLATECREYQELLDRTNRRYFDEEEFKEIKLDYLRISRFSPEFEMAGKRQHVVDLVMKARRLIAGARGTDRTRQLAEAREILDEIRILEPDLPFAEVMLLREYDLLDLDLEIPSVFPAMYRHYAKHPVGQLVVTNRYPIQIDELHLTFRFPGLMPDHDLQLIDGLAPGATVTIPLYADFIESSVLNPALAMYREAEIRATLVTPSISLDRVKAESVRFFDYNHINWKNPLSLAAFVNPTSKSLSRLLVQVNGLNPEPYRDQLPVRNQGIYTAALTFNICKEMNLKYRQDPESMVGDPDQPIDVVNRPEQTLSSGAGDCDDLTVLWASMLMARGVAATGVLLPGHVMLLVDTGIPAERWEDALLPRDMLVLREGRVWLPLEPTMEVGSFLSMVRFASKNLEDTHPSARHYIPFATAGRTFPPAGIDRGDVQAGLNLPRLRMNLEADIIELGRFRAEIREQLLVSAPEENLANSCADLLDRAVALAVIGELDAADQLLIKATPCEEFIPQILNNRGAIALQKKDYLGAQAFFQQALERSPHDRGARINLFLTRLMASPTMIGEMSDEAMESFQDLVASVGSAPLTTLLGGVNPGIGEEGRIHGLTAMNKVHHLVNETLQSVDTKEISNDHLRQRWTKVGYREETPPVVYHRSSGYPDSDVGSVDRDVRHSNIEFPEKIPAGEWTKLRVQIVDPLMRDDQGHIIGVWELLNSESSLEIEGVASHPKTVYFRVSGDGLIVDGEGPHILNVPTQGPSNIVEISLKAERPGPMGIRIRFYQDGRPLGTVSRTAIAVDDALAESQVPIQTQANIGDSAPAPDLLVEIESAILESGLTQQKFYVHSPGDKLDLQGELIGQTTMNRQPSEWLSEQYRTLENLKNDYMARSTGELDDHVASIGRKIFLDLMPQKLQQILRTNKLQTIVFQTDEMLIPWELACFALEGEEATKVRFLADRCQVARWSGPRTMPAEIRINRALLVAVRAAEGKQPLEQSTRTRFILQGLGSGGLGVTEVDPSYEEMASFLADDEIGLYHFECHGEFVQGGDLSTLHLRSGRLRAQYLNNPGYQLGRARPMIFLDACHAGRSGLSIAGAGGWAYEAMDAGASAFIAPLWEVDAQAAGIFAGKFYEQLNQGATLGQAVSAARELVRQEDGTYTWLAYSVYGDPNARFAGARPH